MCGLITTLTNFQRNALMFTQCGLLVQLVNSAGMELPLS